MIKYPLYFEGGAKSAKGVNTPFEASADNYPPIACSIPEGFLGPGGGYSPEDLYLLAVTTCLIATFKVFAEKAQVAYTEISAKAKLTIDRNAQGIPELQKIDVTFLLTGVEDQEKAKTVLGEAEKYCLVSNAIKSEKTFNYQFS
ncbi:MAG: hypothetical protein K1000chlam2_01073 [Chlamydiae bacterium]|nr:hypothetical protein [Chlamydiota bacterium]